MSTSSNPQTNIPGASFSAQCAEDDEKMDDLAPNTSLNPAEFLKMKPKKSILKPKQTSFDDLSQASEPQDVRGDSDEGQKAHFDEMNILATHHPTDKDYGHMKIDEPKTPYTGAYSDSEGEELSTGGSRPRRVSLVGAVDAEQLRKGISEGVAVQPKVLGLGSSEERDEEEMGMTPEQIAHKREFEKKRKMHYNEGLFLRQLKEQAKRAAEQEDDDDD